MGLPKGSGKEHMREAMVLKMKLSGAWLASAVRPCLIAICAGSVVGCGGGGELDDAGSGSALTSAGMNGDGRASALSASMTEGESAAVAAGTIRMGQMFSYPIGGEDRTSTPGVVEDVLSKFDARRIPLNIVACGTVLNEPTPPQTVVFGLVLDVRVEDRAYAEGFGFREVGAGQTALQVFNTGACSNSAPTITAEQRIHGFAQRVYPELFAQWADAGTFEQYRYRYYAGRQNYLGIAGDDVYVHNGRDWNFLYVGKVKDFIPYVDGIPGTPPANGAGQ